MRVRVTEIIEVDTDRVLLGGLKVNKRKATGKRKTLHVRRNPQVDDLVRRVRGGEMVEVEF